MISPDVKPYWEAAELERSKLQEEHPDQLVTFNHPRLAHLHPEESHAAHLTTTAPVEGNHEDDNS